MVSIAKYRELLRKIDSFSTHWREESPLPLSCKQGCSDCCQTHLTLFAVEIAAIAEVLAEQGISFNPRDLVQKNGSCPFLKGKSCIIYEHRPVMCRTQGYPVLYRDDAGQTVSDICPHNRATGEMTLSARFVLDLETLNRCLSSLNYLYLAEMEEQGTVVPFRLDILEVLGERLETKR